MSNPAPFRSIVLVSILSPVTVSSLAAAAPGDDALAPSDVFESEAAAEPAEIVHEKPGTRHFADAGTNVISGWSNLGLYYTTFANTEVEVSGFNADLGFDRFVARGFSVGGYGAYSTETNKRGSTSTTKTYAAGIRGGLAHAFSDVTAIWLRVGVTIGGAEYTNDSPTVRADDHETFVALQAQAPLLFQPAQHLFVGFGPGVWVDFTRSIENDSGPSHRRFSIGGSLIVGGWF